LKPSLAFSPDFADELLTMLLMVRRRTITEVTQSRCWCLTRWRLASAFCSVLAAQSAPQSVGHRHPSPSVRGDAVRGLIRIVQRRMRSSKLRRGRSTESLVLRGAEQRGTWEASPSPAASHFRSIWTSSQA
jgi:hypothetical protein